HESTRGGPVALGPGFVHANLEDLVSFLRAVRRRHLVVADGHVPARPAYAANVASQLGLPLQRSCHLPSRCRSVRAVAPLFELLCLKFDDVRLRGESANAMESTKRSGAGEAKWPWAGSTVASSAISLPW